jgi:hypothetical protein
MSNSNHKIILFSEPNFKGKALVVFDKIEDLFHVLNDWNDKAQSLIVVKGNWSLKAGVESKDENPDESAVPFLEGEQHSFLEPGLNKGITSLLPVWPSPPMPPEVQ